jgi:two-component system response regulator PilR (NtrC family)
MPVPRLTSDVIAQLADHPLDGNVRELENLLHRAVALSDGDELNLDFMSSGPGPLEVLAPAAVAEIAAPARVRTPAAARPEVPSDLQSYLDQQEREVLVRALQETGFNRTAAAARLGLSLRQMRYRIARLGITMPQGDDGLAGIDE